MLPSRIPSLQSLEILDSSVHLWRPSGDIRLFARLGEVMAGRHLSLAGAEIQRPHWADGDESHSDSDSDSGHGDEL